MLGGTENLILPGGPLVAGFAAGMLHVVSGPDHVAALAPLAVRNRLHAMRTGAVWGAGHGTGVLILGSLGIFARHLIDINFLSRWSEWFVGMMLLAIGLWAARQTFILHRQGFGRTKRGSLISSSSFSSLPTEPLSPSEKGKVQLRVRPSSQHVEVDLSPAEKGEKVQLRDDTAAAAPKHAGSTAFGVGVLHGAAGTGHIFGVLPSLALPPVEAAVYLVSYLVAAILAMSGVGCLLGSIGDIGGPKAILYLMGTSSAVAITIGIWWILRTHE
mmetsp:Transcript_14679/g.20271  ORF Transcript_14679/g.20271 Transcript_14679/m.20271 type:complete len:272 (+) Transcript_14679:247-1062(+)|eukprot:CAMPEP_0196598494 /NCGR_PEP_ID=MMETSP1081-20130531/94352_1 /TAXON_ID=36882 /ORGANISM="Pyramimonas amylifera, Strain CCMP720" /LENGTH=271 /DNA_ID=CAMNT_0041924197 /DNA_START=235 /DNA_END=1050 /DNA_ORIENTATION=-